eukprot:5408369-Pyramimonas_sp.AAC.1
MCTASTVEYPPPCSGHEPALSLDEVNGPTGKRVWRPRAPPGGTPPSQPRRPRYTPKTADGLRM